jgi:ubiquinone/menaquinone biosynthesis C-methylase UbiE
MTQDYIHGYSREEQRRLVEQAAVLAPNVFAGLDLSASDSLLEIGCGVGAELLELRNRGAHLQLAGIDHSPAHLAAARDLLAADISRGTARLARADACALPFAAGSFDTAVTIWMLEHVPNPGAVLAEALRVLTPDGLVICTEVDNDSFVFEPPVPAISRWWDRFNRYQRQAGGDPFVGRRLHAIAKRLECREIRTETLPIIASHREPARRLVKLEYLESLLLSGAERLIASGAAGGSDVRGLRDAFASVRADGTIEVRYFAVRLTCRPPA